MGIQDRIFLALDRIFVVDDRTFHQDRIFDYINYIILVF